MERRAAYYGLVVVTLLNFLNYIDRYILAAVLPRMQSELSLTNTQAGLLATAFLFAYFITSPIFGALGDRLSRTRLMAVRVSAWSVATAATGIMWGFVQLMIARSCVEVGEAAYATISPALLSDYFPRSQRGRAFAIFYVAIPVGAASGYLLGGVGRASVGLARGLLCGWLTRHHYGTAGGDGSGSAPGRFGRIRILDTRAAQRHTAGFLAKSCIYRDSTRVCGIHICSQRSRLLDAGIFGKSSRRNPVERELHRRKCDSRGWTGWNGRRRLPGRFHFFANEAWPTLGLRHVQRCGNLAGMVCADRIFRSSLYNLALCC